MKTLLIIVFTSQFISHIERQFASDVCNKMRDKIERTLTNYYNTDEHFAYVVECVGSSK